MKGLNGGDPTAGFPILICPVPPRILRVPPYCGAIVVGSCVGGVVVVGGAVDEVGGGVVVGAVDEVGGVVVGGADDVVGSGSPQAMTSMQAMILNATPR